MMMMSKRPNIPEDRREYTDHVNGELSHQWKGNESCCWECGVQYLTEAQKRRSSAITARHGTCCVCHKMTTVMPIRHYNYLRKVNDEWYPDSGI